jgi:uncharacterized protein YdcH (DUF465 family)
MDNIQTLKTNAKTLRLIQTRNTLEKLIHTAEAEEQSYTAFLKGDNKDDVQ